MNHRQIDKRLAGTSEVLIVSAQASVVGQPCEGALHDPSLGQHLEPPRARLRLDDVYGPCVDLANPFQPQSSVCLVSIDNEQAGQAAGGPSHQRFSAFFIRNASRVYDYHQQQSQSIHQNVAFAPLDKLTPIKAYASWLPPFWVVLTDWLSTTTVLGEGLRPAFVRTSLTKAAFMRSRVPSSLHKPKYQYTMRQEGNS
jgi:hypothetical protein